MPARPAAGEEVAAADDEGSTPLVMAAFMTRMRTDDEPCRPNGMTRHSNWLNCDRKLVFQLSESRRRTWW